jgi:hypothetical protein
MAGPSRCLAIRELQEGQPSLTLAFGIEMKTAKRPVLVFLGLTITGLMLGSGLSAVATTFILHEGRIGENLDCALVSLVLSPFVLTLGLPLNLTSGGFPWIGWISLAGLCVWLAGLMLAFRGRPGIAYSLGFGGAVCWAIMTVPALKMMNSV